MKTPSAMFNDVMKKKNKKNRKGFSLVELIVVLVIMAILAAALIPTLVGYIKQTRQSNVKDEAASCVKAAQTIISSAYASSDGKYYSQLTNATIDVTFSGSGTETVTGSGADLIKEATALAEVPGTLTKVTYSMDTLTITDLHYTSKDGKTKVEYKDGYTVVSDFSD